MVSRYWIKITSFLKPPMSIVDSCFVLSSWPPTHRHLIGAPACVLFSELSPSAGSSLHTQLYSCLLSSVIVPWPSTSPFALGTSLLCNFFMVCQRLMGEQVWFLSPALKAPDHLSPKAPFSLPLPCHTWSIPGALKTRGFSSWQGQPSGIWYREGAFSLISFSKIFIHPSARPNFTSLPPHLS